MHDARIAWHLSEILTVVTGYDVSPQGEGAGDTLEEYLAGRALSTVDRLRYARAFREALLGQYPELAAYRNDVPMPAELIPEWLRRRVAEFGEYLPVRPLRADHAACRLPALGCEA